MKYLSLFSGIGGFELGITQAYVEIINRTENGRGQENKERNEEDGKGLEPAQRESSGSERGWDGEHSCLINSRCEPPYCVGFSEIDKYASKIYQHHFPEHKNYGDITKIDPTTLPDFDLLVGGFPCQAFSIAGKRRGFADTRGTLFFDIARILKAKTPRLLLLENVKGLLSHDNGKTFSTIISTLDELGYDLQWQVLNSKNFGVPQNRERVFIVGHLRGTSRPQVFPIGGQNENPTEEPAANEPVVIGSSQRHAAVSRGIVPTLSTAMGQGGGQTPMILAHYGHTDKPPVEMDISPTLKAQSHGHEPLVAKTVRSGGRNSPHGSKQNWDSYEFEGKIRRLTPTECARLQGFPDHWHKVEGISDTQAYKCYGNAVTVNVIKEIVKRMI